MDVLKVLEEYRNGDEGKRLSLFMAYRELRDQFAMIEEETSHDDFLILTFPWTKKRRLAQAA
ncbi:MAG TPA: hypothetical protein VK654_16235 [Nitrospirota bacterium]|nr:hypothetical protein [Nitrospirota bacterium]